MTSRYYWVLPQPTEVSLLLLRAGEGWSLPAIEHEEGWFPKEAGLVARQIGDHLGLAVTALRHLHEGHEGEFHIGELENHSPGWTPPENARWVGSKDMETLHLAEPSHRATLQAWLAEAESGVIPPLRPPWERRGWLDEASAWIGSQLARLGCVATGPIEQLKVCWSGSCLLRVATAAGDLYFKADYAKPPSEPAIIAALAQRWPDNVPVTLAVDLDRRWMLMSDFGGQCLGALALEYSEGAMRRFAEIQRDCSTNISGWLELGCPDHRLDTMAERQEMLLAGAADLLPGHPERLTETERVELRRLAPHLQEMWSELAEYAVPVSIVQQDFREGNVVATGDSYVYFDWSDTVVSHPFFSATRWLAGGISGGRTASPAGEQGRRLRDAYLEPWTVYESRERLVEAFQTARQLHTLYQAIRWYRELPYLEPTSPFCLMIARSVLTHLREVLRGAVT